MRSTLLASALFLVLAVPSLVHAWSPNGVTPSVTRRNGSGVNPILLRHQREPAIGDIFVLKIDCSTFPDPFGMAYISMNASGIAGLPTRYGELLVDLTSPQYVFIASIQFGTINSYQLQLPNDPVLCGTTATAQGWCQGNGVIQLTNALDIVVGS